MLAPRQLAPIKEALSPPGGLLDLAAVVLCFAAAFAVDRRVRLGSGAESRLAKISAGSVNRLLFPLTALLLLLVVRGVLRHWHDPAFFEIAVPLVLALALIRLFVYGLHNVFGPSRWLPVSERAISYTICAALLLYYISALKESGDALSEARLPIGKSELSALHLARDALVLILAISGSLCVSVILEHRLMRTATR